jgi:type III restriction enzyme
MLELRDYQQRSLETLEGFLRRTTQHGAKTAFVLETNRPYREVPQLPALPYVCLRVPTGGGKTLMACHTVGLVAENYLQSERAVCLWLVPSNTIREQTLAALRNRKHPYREALELRFGGQATVIDLSEALYVKPGTLRGETTVIVSTLAALRVEETEGRKIYESSGALMDHFSGIGEEQKAKLERLEDNTLPYSLCNVLRLHRPVVIMDEAHNARTQLSFETLARFNPSCIVEFTATPELEHKPDKGYFASNVLHHVSAAELKAEDMVKLPIKLFAEFPDWKMTVSETLKLQRELEAIAFKEEMATGEYIRPLVLFQAQAKSKEKQTITVDVLKQTLLEDFKIPEEQIAIATGETRGIDNVNLFERSCPLRFIITVQALKEGWDCSFAYILCSVAEISSAKSIEQLLGRVLRLPRAQRKRHEQLNCAYAFAASAKFNETAVSLKDALVENGFQRIEVGDLIKPYEQQATLIANHPLAFETEEIVEETPDLSALPVELQPRVKYESSTKKLVVSGIVSDSDKFHLETCFRSDQAKKAVQQIYHCSRGATKSSESEGRPSKILVPGLAIQVNKQRELFEESHFLDAAWKLSERDASISEADFSSTYSSGKMGELDVSEQGKLEILVIEEVQKQMRLMGFEPGWDIFGLTNWLDRQIPHPDIIRTEATLFIHRALELLMASRSLSLDQLAQQKYRLRTALAAKIETHRIAAKRNAYHRMLFSPEKADFEVTPAHCFEISKEYYAANWYYEGSYKFRKHLFPLIGELKSDGEEFECAVFLDQLESVKHWVRNLERRKKGVFWLQTASDKFYPDFVALLNDDRILVVESKGKHLWTNDDSKEKRVLGELWASRSIGKCLFIMPNGAEWESIRACVNKPI